MQVEEANELLISDYVLHLIHLSSQGKDERFSHNHPPDPASIHPQRLTVVANPYFSASMYIML